MIDVQSNADTVHILIYPNQNMSHYGYWIMFSLIALVSLVFSIGLASKGDWAIVPFALLYLMFVWWGFKKAYDSTEVIQYITIKPKKTTLGNSKIGKIQSYATPWVRVKLIKDRKNHQSMRLFLLAHDKMREIGLGIIEDERVELSHKIQRAISPYSAYI